MDTKKLNPKKSLIANPRGSIDSKLTQKAMLLSYQFDYGVNFEDRIIKLTGEINAEMFDLVDTALTELENLGKKDITIKINSPGGEAYQAMAIVGRMAESKCKIVTKGYGMVMSAATIILAAGTRRREMSRFGQFMWHECSYEIDGRHSHIKDAAVQVDLEERFWAKSMAKFTKKTAKFWLEQGVRKDANFSPEQLLKLGVVDGIF